MASHGGKGAARVWRNVSAERAAATLLVEHDQRALEQARLEATAAKRARRQNLRLLEAARGAAVCVGSTAMVDPPRQLLVSRVSERRVDRGAVLDGLQTALIVVDQSGVITQARAGRSGDQKL